MDIMKAHPESKDFEEIERKYGKPKTDQQRAEHYRLAQANALMRHHGLHQKS